MNALPGVLILAILIALVAALLRLSDVLHARRAEEIARQIDLTDAVHARMGAVLAPVVTKPFRRPWQIRLAAPIDNPQVVEQFLAAVAEEFASADPGRPERFQVVLSPRQDADARTSRPHARAARRDAVTSWT